MKARAFATEAALCAAFIAWAAKQHPGVRVFAEWAGWDILLVLPEGWQVGIQAKLRLNAEVIGQAAPDSYGWDFEHAGPDFRAVLVPDQNPLAGIASRLGLVVFYGRLQGYPTEHWTFFPSLGDSHDYSHSCFNQPWFDWNPARRHALPPTATDAIAGSPCPVTLTPWKIGALDVLAEVAVSGQITTKRIREIGLNPARWLTCCWLMPGEKRGLWVRGDRCPKFDEQHPAAYALALEKAKAAA